MGKKFTTDTIKDLKQMVLESGEELLKIYTKKEFKGNDTIILRTEDTDLHDIDPKVVVQMIRQLTRIL
jgi:methanogenic corrinoid protein MtbC1